MSLSNSENCFVFKTFCFCNSTITSSTDKKLKGLSSNILATTTPVVFFGSSRLNISSLFKSLTEIFRVSIIISFLVSGFVSFSALNTLEDSNLPN